MHLYRWYGYICQGRASFDSGKGQDYEREKQTLEDLRAMENLK
ncbi:MAG: hypothetical protein ACYCZO_04830 [Daejeonella sp.]